MDEKEISAALARQAMVLIQLLLPTTISNESAPQHAATALAETRRELADKFAGLTAYVRSPAKGTWTSPEGRTEEDDVVMIEIVTDRFDRGWWRKYADTLSQRFAQDAIHVRATAIELLNEDEDAR